MKEKNYLNRFTLLRALFGMLQKRCIFLREFAEWEDKNDVGYLEKYKREKGLKTLLVCCFSGKRETFHHWKVFAEEGVCIEFHRKELIASIDGIKGVHHHEVDYHHIEYGEVNNGWTLKQLPFLKRRVYTDEAEYRIIYESHNREETFKELPLNLNCIEKINLSPWLIDSVAQETIRKIRGIDGCENLNVIPSTVLKNPRWLKLLESLKDN